MCRVGFAWLSLLGLLLSACSDDGGSRRDAAVDGSADASAVDPPAVFEEVDGTGQVSLPGLDEPAFVVFTESNVPHVYAETREDAARVLGYVMARDRYAMMDLARRLAQGRLAALLGQDALQTDLESRGMGMTRVARAMTERLTEAQRRRFSAFSEGVNAYIEAVDRRQADPPKEHELAAQLLYGTANVAELMEPFSVEDVMAVGATVTYQLGFENGDVDRERAARRLQDAFEGQPLAERRSGGAWDLYRRVTPINGYRSGSEWGLETREDAGGSAAALTLRPGGGHTRPQWMPELATPMLERLSSRLGRMEDRLGRNHPAGFGSNAWAVRGENTADGAAILAGDGHLGLQIPSLFYRMGLDTALVGDGNTQQVGLAFPGVPLMAVGTNGQVAWSQTQFFGDITDWYREEIVLDGQGVPEASMFQGERRPLSRIEEQYEVADIEALDSEGRTETWTRFETFDGRMIASIEGREVDADATPGEGESIVNVMGDFIVPADTDGDGTITAVSFDYTGLEGPNFALSLDDWGHASTVREMYEASDALVAYSQNIIAADHTGSVLFTPYQVMPCREYLTREDDGSWAPGANPRRLIDGTRFRGFDLPLTDAGRVDEEAGQGDPHRCVVPFDEYPAVIDPERGYVVSANNDPGDMAADNSLTNDPWYIGGPWHEDFRATRIADRIEATAGEVDEDSTAALQADVRSPLGAMFTPLILESVQAARSALEGNPPDGSAEARLAARWEQAGEDYQRFAERMRAWRDAGYPARSGVETFYTDASQSDREHAVATMLFNAWLGAFMDKALDDEPLPAGIYTPTGGAGRMRMLKRMLEGRGRGNPLDMPSWNPETEESAFFDVLGTEPIETSEEITIGAIDDALAFLRSEPSGPGRGGFGNDEWDTWRWGRRHHVTFTSLLADFLGSEQQQLATLVEQFSITPETLPLAEELSEGDFRAELPGFPRPGDNFAVDAANPGFSAQDFTFDAGPVFRMVIALRGEETTGRNIMPGGQSGRPDSDHFADQAAMWLANDATPMRLTPEQVAEGATARETFVPQ
jgi:penicillin amidase